MQTKRYLPPECNCYARKLSEEVIFMLHRGAHNPTCPAYVMSQDYVDRVYDREFRLRHEDR